LERLGLSWQAVGDNEVKVCCPAHDDATPSASINVESGLWRCHAAGCQKKGDIVALLAYCLKADRKIVVLDLQRRYPELIDAVSFDTAAVERYHQRIWDSGPLLKALRARAITDEMIRSARLGVNDGRVTIPLFNLGGRCLNVKSYLPGAKAADKMRSIVKGRKQQIYQPDQLDKHDDIWICGGELKALVAGALLNPHNIGACSSTGGEGSWNHEWTPLFKGKHVVICMDVDRPGQSAAVKIARLLAPVAKSIKIAQLPLDKKRFPTGDINDWVAKCDATADDFLKLADAASFWVAPVMDPELAGDPIQVDVETATSRENVGRKLEFTAMTAAMDQTPYLVPTSINVVCTRDQNSCGICSIYSQDPDVETGFVLANVSKFSSSILRMAGASSKEQHEAVREGLRIPKCKAVEFITAEYSTVVDVRLTHQLEITGKKTADVWQPAFIIDETIELNQAYKFVGTVQPHPKTQQATLIVSESEDKQDTLDSFEPSEQELDELERFQPSEWTLDSLEAKLNDIWAELENAVTRIFCRRRMHATMDAVWHSPLMFRMDDRLVNGWMNVLVLGDSAQGKSEAALRLQEHYGLGDRIDCKNATLAGILGGLEQLGNRWFVRWGALPMHDKRLVILEEVKGASTEVLAKLTDVRSSGIAQLPKIERREAHARTRLLMISNPRKPRPVSSFNYGVEAVQELIGALEDVRRFDFAIVLSADDVDEDEISRMVDRPIQKDGVYTSELCRRLILWSWTRTLDQVVIDADVKTPARALVKRYVDVMPLIDKGTTTQKVARFAAALAARTFSCDDDMSTLVVRQCHVDLAAKIMDAEYSSPTSGYLELSDTWKSMSDLNDPETVRRCILNVRHPHDFIAILLRRDSITIADIQDGTGLDRQDAQEILSLLVRKHALIRVATSNDYTKNPKFITILKNLSEASLETIDQIQTKDEEF
jgi:hypothetical protein